MAIANKVKIVGIGDDGLDGVTSSTKALIESADVLIGPDHVLRLLPKGKFRRIVVGNDMDELLKVVGENSDKHVVFLTPGDPLFYGTARYLCERLGKDRFDVLPHVSSMQLAFARVKETWEDAYLTSVSSHPLEVIVEKIRVAAKVGLFTDDANPPKVVAQAMLDRGIDYFIPYVCENLGSPDERVTTGDLKEIASQDFSPLNVMVLVRRPNAPDRPSDRLGKRLFGNPDEAFLQSKPKKGLLTPAEVRSLALAELDLGNSSTVWDIGAGSGSVAIEAAQISAAGTVYAVEMDAEDHALIVANSSRFGVKNLVPILGRAPEAWQGLPDPDCIFVGGTGREVTRLIQLAFERLRPKGRMAVNVSSMENVADVHALLQGLVGDVRVWMINIARGTHQFERVRFDALTPTFLLSVVKP